METLVGTAVDLAIVELPRWQSHRNVLTVKLVEALETSAFWVDLYSITGQLNVPEGVYSDDILEPLERIKQVGFFVIYLTPNRYQSTNQILIANRHVGLEQGIWREIKIPVDIPEMSVSNRTMSCIFDLNLPA